MTITAPETLTEHLLAPITLADGDGAAARREFEALAVPYDVEVDRENWRLGTKKLRIAKGAAKWRDDAKLFYGHDWQLDGIPIGRVVTVTETDDGPRTLNRIAKTPKGDEVYALMQPDEDGVAVLDKVSIGFYINAYSVEGADTDSPVLVCTDIDVFELSVVPFPQYDGAAVDNVLNNQRSNSMTAPAIEAPVAFSQEDGATLSATVEQLNLSVEELGAKIATLGSAAIPDSPAQLLSGFNSYGEYAKALAAGDDEAKKFAAEAERLAYAGGTSDDTIYGDTWVGENLRLVENARRVWNLFESGKLPAEGTTLEYGKIATNTIDVDEQLDEGDAIVMGNITIGTGHADVLTFAGGSELTLQQAKRSNVNVLDLHFRALGIAYGKTTEAYVRSVLADPAQVAPKMVGTLAGLADIDGWIDFLIDGAMWLDDKGLAPEYLRMTVDQFKILAKLREGTDGPFLLNRETGRINLLDRTGAVAGLQISVEAGTNLVELGNSFALKTYEDGAAPARLGPQEDITTLTQAIGVYGFGAVAVQDEKAIVRVATA